MPPCRRPASPKAASQPCGSSPRTGATWTRRNSLTYEQNSACKPKMTLRRTRRGKWDSAISTPPTRNVFGSCMGCAALELRDLATRPGLFLIRRVRLRADRKLQTDAQTSTLAIGRRRRSKALPVSTSALPGPVERERSSQASRLRLRGRENVTHRFDGSQNSEANGLRPSRIVASSSPVLRGCPNGGIHHQTATPHPDPKTSTSTATMPIFWKGRSVVNWRARMQRRPRYRR